MKQHTTLYLLLAMVIASCSNEPQPDLPDFRIIPTNSPMEINGMIERNGEISIFGANDYSTELISWGAVGQCLEINDFSIPIPRDNEIALYSTLSTDGRTWRDDDTFVSNINDVYFLDDQVGFLQTRLQGLFKTTDGGNSWEQILKGNVNYYCNGRFPLRFEEVHFKNEMEGYVVDSYQNNFILKTTDGGNHWNLLYPTETDLMSGQLRTVRDVYFVPNSAVAYWRVGLHGGYRKSVDGGQTWDVQTEETGAQDIKFINASVGYYLQNDALYKTTDGGTTWANTAPDVPYNSPNKLRELYGPNHLTVVDENTLYVTGEGSGNDVYQSLDGGQTFTRLKVPKIDASIKGIYQGPSGKVYAYGSQGLLMELK